MSLKLSDITAAKAERFPDFVVDAEDEQGNQLELRFRPAYVMDEAKRAELTEIAKKLAEVEEDEGLDIRELCIQTMRITARDPYHFEVLEKYVADNTEEGDVDTALWLTIFDLYKEHTQLGEA